MVPRNSHNTLRVVCHLPDLHDDSLGSHYRTMHHSYVYWTFFEKKKILKVQQEQFCGCPK